MNVCKLSLITFITDTVGKTVFFIYSNMHTKDCYTQYVYIFPKSRLICIDFINYIHWL